MRKHDLTPDLLLVIADRFKAMSDPTRLRILNALRKGELTVTELVQATGLGQTNVSKHLHVLYASSLVVRRRSGPFVHYRIADARLFRLCDMVCDQLRDEADGRGRVVSGGPRWTTRIFSH